MRMMRDSPAELARELPGPYASISKTRLSRRAKCEAVHAPKTPAPTTTTSNRSIAPASHRGPHQRPARNARPNPIPSAPAKHLRTPEHAPYLIHLRRRILRVFSANRVFRPTTMLLSYAPQIQNQTHRILRRLHASPFLYRHNPRCSRGDRISIKRRLGPPATKRINKLRHAKSPAPQIPARRRRQVHPPRRSRRRSPVR